MLVSSIVPSVLYFSKAWRMSNNVMQKWGKIFRSNNVTDPWYSVKWLAQYVNKNAMCASFDFSASELRHFEGLCEKRLQHEPIQYIIGEWPFCGFEFKIKPPTLIFRPETEHFVDIVTDYYNNNTNKHHSLKFMEIGCGSGVITATLLNRFTNSSAIAVDCESHAIQLTDINCKLINVIDRVEIIQTEVKQLKSNTLDDLDFIVSNPPYILSSEMKDLAKDIYNYEDHVALDGGNDGLDVINDILKICPQYLKDDGLIWLECHHSHCEKFRKTYNVDTAKLVQTYHDFHNCERFACFKKIS